VARFAKVVQFCTVSLEPQNGISPLGTARQDAKAIAFMKENDFSIY
jgi:hypothetical protein